jgi:hypothetical protein
MRIFFDQLEMDETIDKNENIDKDRSHLVVTDDRDVYWYQYNIQSPEGEKFHLLNKGIIMI